MAQLPQQVTDEYRNRVAQAIAAAYEKNQEDGRRPHLGSSIIGRECRRQIWHMFRWSETPAFDGRMLRLFDTGHKAEARFVADLRATGAEVVELDVDGKQFRVSDFGGHLGGSTDGVGRGLVYGPKTWAVLEFKTHGSKSFAKLKNHGVRVAKPEHYGQVQIYMLKLGLDRALYLAVNKDTDELHDEWITLDKAFAESLIAVAGEIIASPTPPAGISAERGDWRCKFCDFQELCFGDQVPEGELPQLRALDA